MSALASRLTAANAPVRLKLVETASALEAADMFSSNKTDLAVVRGDVGDLSQAQAVIVLARAVVLLVAPPGSSITDIAGLKRLTVGVVGGEMNRKVVSALTEEYDLGRANVIVPQPRARGDAARARSQGGARAPDRRSPGRKIPGAAAWLLSAKPEDRAGPYPYRCGRRHCREAARLRKLRCPERNAAGLASDSQRRSDHAQGFVLSWLPASSSTTIWPAPWRKR